MMDERTALLRVAAELIRQRGYCQGAEARDGAGRPVHPQSRSARSFSVSGALYAASGFDGSPERRQQLEAALRCVPVDNLRVWEDRPGRTRDEALALLDATVAMIEMGGPPPPSAIGDAGSTGTGVP